MESGFRLTFSAVEPGTIIIIVMAVISFISWILKLVNEKAQHKAPRPAVPNRPARDDRFEQEIDAFLQQVGGRRAVRREHEEVAIEVVPESELRERQAAERRERKLSSIEDRHVETSQLGSAVRALHYEGLESKVEQDVGNHIGAAVEADLGEAVARENSASQPPAPVRADDIVSLLRDPAGVRRAIIVNEILTRRKRR